MLATTFRSAALALLVAGWMTAANDPFVGKWKYNPDKSKVVGQRFKVEDLGANKYKIDGGAVAQVVVADGTDQPIEFGGTASLLKTGENTWKIVCKRDGRVLSENTLTLSPDGKTLTARYTGTRLDGSTFDDLEVMTRVAGTGGLAGAWETKSEKESAPTVWEIQPYEGGLSFVYPSSKGRLDIKFDGKDYTEQGPNAPKGVVTSGKRLDSNTIQITNKHDGKVLDTAECKVSTDGKTITMTVHSTGQAIPLVVVYERQ